MGDGTPLVTVEASQQRLHRMERDRRCRAHDLRRRGEVERGIRGVLRIMAPMLPPGRATYRGTTQPSTPTPAWRSASASSAASAASQRPATIVRR